jgi:hypothetical protein
LVNGVSARDFASHQDNSYYTPVSTTGTSVAEIRAAILDVANWTRGNTRYSSLPAWDFILENNPTDPLFTDATMNAVLSDQPGGVVRLSFTGIPGRVYGIERSENLGGWTQIGSITTPVDGVVIYDDASPLPGKGFYRVRFPSDPGP